MILGEEIFIQKVHFKLEWLSPFFLLFLSLGPLLYLPDPCSPSSCFPSPSTDIALPVH